MSSRRRKSRKISNSSFHTYMKLVPTDKCVTPEELAKTFGTDTKTIQLILDNPEQVNLYWDVYREAVRGGWLVE